MTSPEIVIEEVSPSGNLEAIIEQDDRVAYFYLRSPENESFGLKSCWIRNISKAPHALDVQSMRQGMAPMLPHEYCLNPEGQPRLDPKRLRLVWFPEGDGVALMEEDEMLAAIPAWAGKSGFSGYARDCIGESPLCWKLHDPTEFNARILAAERYWQQWDQVESPWAICQDSLLAAYERELGAHSRYFAIDGGAWPPKALVRFDLPDSTYLLSLGISLRPQPSVEMYYDAPADFRRFELGAFLSSGVSDEVVTSLARYLSAQSNLPWLRFTFLGHGHTIPTDVFECDANLRIFTSVLLVDSVHCAPNLKIPPIDGDKVTLLLIVPITSEEQQLAKRDGSKRLMDQISSTWPIHLIGARTPTAAS